MSKEPVAALRLEKHGMFCLVCPVAVIGTQGDVPVPTSAVTWRAKKGLVEVMTSRTWLNHGLSHKAKNTRLIRFAEILTGPCSGQSWPQRDHTSQYAVTTEVGVLLRYDSDGQG